jgi:hypothetical protein
MIPINISSLSLKHDGINEFWRQKEAERLFTRAYRKGLARRLIAGLFGHSSRICQASQAKRLKHTGSRHYEGLRAVPLNRICGSENRTADFDNQFHPLHQHTKWRWVAVAVEMLRGRNLPPVELLDMNGVYCVRDGHHRVSAARALGQREIDARITR